MGQQTNVGIWTLSLFEKILKIMQVKNASMDMTYFFSSPIICHFRFCYDNFRNKDSMHASNIAHNIERKVTFVARRLQKVTF
jgi:hypothetical protein